VLEDVVVMVGVLADAAQAVDLGEHYGEGAEGGEPAQRTSRDGRCCGEKGGKLVAEPFAGDAGQRRCRATGGAQRGPVRFEPQGGREPRQTEDAQGVVGERRVATQAQPPTGEVGVASEGITERPGHQSRAAAPPTRVGHDLARHRVDRGVAGGEVGVEALAAQRRDIDVTAAGKDAERGEALRRCEDGGAEATGEAARERFGGAVDHEVEVAHGATEQVVAHGPADDPRAPPLAELGPRRRDDVGRTWTEHVRRAWADHVGRVRSDDVGRGRVDIRHGPPATASRTPRGRLSLAGHEVRPRAPRRGSGAPPAAIRRTRPRS